MLIIDVVESKAEGRIEGIWKRKGGRGERREPVQTAGVGAACRFLTLDARAGDSCLAAALLQHPDLASRASQRNTTREARGQGSASVTQRQSVTVGRAARTGPTLP